MKTVYLLLSFALTIYSTGVFCQQSQVEPFKIDINSAKTIRGYGTGGGFVTPKRGFKCILVELTLTNMSNEDAKIELSDFKLLDTVKKVSYLPQAVMANTLFTFGAKANKKVKPGDKIERNIYFFVEIGVAVRYFAYRNDIYIKD